MQICLPSRSSAVPSSAISSFVKRSVASLALTLLAIVALALSSPSIHAQQSVASQPTILYGVAYYNEYMPADLQPGRLDKDTHFYCIIALALINISY